MYVTVHDQNIFVSTGGRAFQPDAPVLLLIHGSGQSHLTWLLQARFFANRGWSVLAPDFPAHGLSGGEPLTSISEMADWCHDLLETLKVDQATAVGHSQGGLVTLELASRHPHRVNGVGLIALGLTIGVNPALIDMADHNEMAAFDAMLSWGHGRDGKFHDHPMPGNSHVNLGKRIMADNPAGTLAADLRACAAYQNGADAASKITQPTVIILAKEDQMTPWKHGKAMAAAIPHASTVTIPDAGHMLPIERSDEVNQALRQLLEGQKAK
jgi:pimeloyl-ACP methyl ester carboxylesterase